MKKIVPALAGAALVMAFGVAQAEDIPTTPFTYGGDETFSYAGGKVGTGAKDPSVCGTVDEAAWLKAYEANTVK